MFLRTKSTAKKQPATHVRHSSRSTASQGGGGLGSSQSQAAPPTAPTEPPKDYQLSGYSTPAVPYTMWNATDYLLAAGLCILQPETNKVVVVHDKFDPGHYFLPRGRKDPGESLETTALREGYEESGYRAQFLPLFMSHLQPTPPELKERRKHDHLNIDHWLSTGEPIFIQMMPVATRYHRLPAAAVAVPLQPPASGSDQSLQPPPALRVQSHAHMYIAHWYVGFISTHAVRETGTGMADEQGYESELMVEEAALKVLTPDHAQIVYFAFRALENTRKLRVELDETKRNAESQQAQAMDVFLSQSLSGTTLESNE